MGMFSSKESAGLLGIQPSHLRLRHLGNSGNVVRSESTECIPRFWGSVIKQATNGDSLKPFGCFTYLAQPIHHRWTS